jgi:hypothetical protein
MSDSLVIEIHNQHTDECGPPPGISKHVGNGFYTSYFESACGDQWLFLLNRTTGVGFFWAGDIGWGKRIEIRENKIQDADLIINRDDFSWLALCWKAATGGQNLEPPLLFDMQDWMKQKEKRKTKKKAKKPAGASSKRRQKSRSSSFI